MLKTLKDLFDAWAPAPSGAPRAHDEHELRLATAVLLVEVMRSDYSLAEAEQAAVRAGLQARFALNDDETARLAELAHASAKIELLVAAGRAPQ